MRNFLTNQKSKKDNSKFEYLYIELENQEKFIRKKEEEKKEEEERGVIIIDII